MITEYEKLAIAQLVIYILIFIPATSIIIRLGFHRTHGWIYLNIFLVVRIAGSVFDVLRGHIWMKRSSTAAWILQSVGPPLVILASLGLLRRVINQTPYNALSSLDSADGIEIGGIGRPNSNRFSRKSLLLRILQAPVMLGMGICIIGGVVGIFDYSKGFAFSKASIIIFLAIFCILTFLTLGSMREFGRASQEDHRILMAVIMALPLLAVYLVWSILCIFTPSAKFNMLYGNVYIQAFMKVLEEALISIMYTGVGLGVQKEGWNR